MKIFGRQCFLYLDVNGHILLIFIPCTYLHFWVCVGEVPTHYFFFVLLHHCVLPIICSPPGTPAHRYMYISLYRDMHCVLR